MISFCAKILGKAIKLYMCLNDSLNCIFIALCYFKIPGLASSLLQALNIRPAIMKRLRTEMTE